VISSAPPGYRARRTPTRQEGTLDATTVPPSSSKSGMLLCSAFVIVESPAKAKASRSISAPATHVQGASSGRPHRRACLARNPGEAHRCAALLAVGQPGLTWTTTSTFLRSSPRASNAHMPSCQAGGESTNCLPRPPAYAGTCLGRPTSRSNRCRGRSSRSISRRPSDGLHEITTDARSRARCHDLRDINGRAVRGGRMLAAA